MFNKSFLTGVAIILQGTVHVIGSDVSIPQPGTKPSRQYASGATSGNLPHNIFSKPQPSHVTKEPIVPHYLPAGGTGTPSGNKTNDPVPNDPCPPGKQEAWIITQGTHEYILFENGKVINIKGHGGSTHEPGKVHEHGHVTSSSEEERNLRRNPLLTAEEEKLREEIEKDGVGGIYDRPGHGKHEFGKELNGKVYFKATSGVKGYKPGLWVEDSNVKPKGKTERPVIAKPKRPEPQATPLPDRPKTPTPPGGLSTTARPNLAKTNPETGQVEVTYGEANVAQEGLTGQKMGKIDVPSSIPPAPPPPPLSNKPAD